MARNIPTTLDFSQFTSDDDSEMPNTTTGTPDDSHMNDFEVLNSSEISERVGFIDRETKYQRDHTIPHVLNRYVATSPLTSLNSDRDADSKTTIRKVFAFDMRGKTEKSVKGKEVFIEAFAGVLEQRLASMNGVLQDQLVFLNVPDNDETMAYAAILDVSFKQNLTVS